MWGLAVPIITEVVKAVRSHKGAERNAQKEKVKEAVKDNFKAPSTGAAAVMAGAGTQVPDNTAQAVMMVAAVILFFIRKAKEDD